MDESLIRSILAALAAGFIVELVKKPDGSIVARTVRRKEIKIEN